MLAVWTGLEPATPCVTGRYSNQLNYHTNFLKNSLPFRKRVQRYRVFLKPPNVLVIIFQKKCKRYGGKPFLWEKQPHLGVIYPWRE